MQTFLVDGCVGWGNGPVPRGDTEGFRRQLRGLRALVPARYAVGVTITPAFAFTNPAPTEAILDVCHAEGVPFWVVVVSSDVLAMLRPDSFAVRCSLGTAFDPSHGIGVPVSTLRRWHTRYGDTFAGCCSHEAKSQSRTNADWRNGSLDWDAPFADYLPGNSFFQHRCQLEFVEFCSRTHKRFIWSDPLYSRSEGRWGGSIPPESGWQEDYGAAKFEMYERWQMGAFPGTVIPTFANNVAALDRLGDYWNDLDHAVAGQWRQAAGWGLYAQTWAASEDGSMTPGALAMLRAWVPDALAHPACAVVWLGTSWALFRWPGYSFGPDGGANAPDSGVPLPEFAEFCAALP